MNLFTQLQIQIADHLLALPYFSAIPVLDIRAGDILRQVEIQRAKANILVAPVFNAASAAEKQVQAIVLNNVDLSVFVFENVLHNEGAAGTKKPANEVAIEVVRALVQFKPACLGGNTLIPAEPFIQRSQDGDEVVVETKWNAMAVFESSLLQLAAITKSLDTVEDSRLLTLAHATPGAAIFYSTTGFPNPQTGTLYTAPFAVTTGQVIRARAYLAGFADSPLLTYTIPAPA